MLPAKSKAQEMFMKAVASGHVTKPGLSKKDAEEFLEHKGKRDMHETMHNDVRKKKRRGKKSELDDAVKGYVERTSK